MTELKPKVEKSFRIDKRVVWQAWKQVKANQGAPGVDEESVAEFERDAVGVCRQRCWKSDWVIDLDLRSFFDTVDHDLILKAVAAHTDERWVLLYVERWLKAPLDQGDGDLKERDRGTPQGSAISPLLANIHLHYALDAWMAREFGAIPFERYADDVVVHAKSERQAQFVLGEIEKRMAACHLELNQEKTRIVYCKDSIRKGSHEHERFDFLDEAAKQIRRTIRRWRLHLWNGAPLTEIAREINATVRGWINYYGRFYPTELKRSLRRIDAYLVRWAMRQYKRPKGRRNRAWRFLVDVCAREPELFAHWRLTQTNGRKVGAV